MARKIKAVYFNSELDHRLLEFADGLSNFSDWVKRRIAREIAKNETGVDPEIAALVERLVEVKLAGRLVRSEENAEAKDTLVEDIDKFF